MIRAFLILFFLFQTLAYGKADEILTDLEDESTVVLNEELRKLGNTKAEQEDLEALEARVEALEGSALTWTRVEDTQTSDTSTSSGSPADTGLSITFTPSIAGLACFHFSGEDDSADSVEFRYALVLDDVTLRIQGGEMDVVDDIRFPLSLSDCQQVTAASHTVKVQVWKDSGTGNAVLDGSNTTAYLSAIHPS